ncbi:Retrovirus-related Pol polyprotein from transposon 297 [Vitis vinifera]|uniref:Retrovirus-related Pol polyprotein from transposon 297 n=1 Tax=Vitis vinifera TaxID=29760 RepID=A0A438CIF4_VITVI|nr:Retrovirus-related Pol polyprotein from transposon 297 [Vitis vinifera]
MEEEAKPIRQPQRRLNPHLQEVVRAEVLKLLQAGIIYPISDSPWVSPTQVVPKKSGITVVQNEKGEEVATCLTSGWRVCIDYRKLNVVTRKDHFPLLFINQVLEKVSGHPFYCFLDGYSGYFQIEIDVEDQEKTILHVHLEHMPTEECHLVYEYGILHIPPGKEFHPADAAIPSCCRHFTPDCRCHSIRLPPLSTRMCHIQKSTTTIPPDVSHPKFWQGDVPHSPDVSHPADIRMGEEGVSTSTIKHIRIHRQRSPESFAANFAQCCGVLLKLPDMCH